MCRIGRLGLTALWLASSPGAGSAQQSQEQLVERLNTLRPLVEASAEELAAYRDEQTARLRAAAAVGARFDTLRVGLVTIVTAAERAEAARELFADVWTEHYSDIVHSPSLERTLFLFRWGSDPVPIHIEGAWHRVQVPGWTRRAGALDRVRREVAAVMTYDLSGAPRVQSWVAGDPHAEQDVGLVYRQLAMTRSRATRACLAGDIASCTTSFGLGAEDDTFLQWYTPEERRSLLGGLGTMARSRSIGPEWDRCVNHGDDAACDRLLRDDRGGLAPLSGPARASLLSLALREGGRGAWGRVLEDPTMSPQEALEHASGLPLATLVSEWRAWVIDGRPDVYAGLGTNGGMAVVWTFLFALLAMRSTRWRLG